MNPHRPARGIRRTPFGWQVYGRVRGQFLSRRFPPETALKVMKDWRHDRRTAIRARQLGTDQDLPPSGTLARDVADYLVIVKAMPTLQRQGIPRPPQPEDERASGTCRRRSVRPSRAPPPR